MFYKPQVPSYKSKQLGYPASLEMQEIKLSITLREAGSVILTDTTPNLKIKTDKLQVISANRNL